MRMQSLTKSAIILLVVCLIGIDQANAKSIAKRETKIDYYDNIIQQLDELRKMPFVGEVIEPWITEVENVLEQSNRMTDKSLGKVFNSVMPCEPSHQFITCQGTLDVESAKVLIKKILVYVIPNMLPEQYTPMIQFAAKIM